MYFNKDNNFFHGIKFHHFHDDVFSERVKEKIREVK